MTCNFIISDAYRESICEEIYGKNSENSCPQQHIGMSYARSA